MMAPGLVAKFTLVLPRTALDVSGPDCGVKQEAFAKPPPSNSFTVLTHWNYKRIGYPPVSTGQRSDNVDGSLSDGRVVNRQA